MKSTDEQLNSILERAETLRVQKHHRRILLVDSVSAAACFLLLLTIALTLPGLKDAEISGGGSGIYGSLILTAPHFGYVIVGILAFLFGISVTMLCVHIRKYR